MLPVLDIFANSGVHAYHKEFQPVSKFKWVNVSRLSYGIPDKGIAALGAFPLHRVVRSSSNPPVQEAVAGSDVVVVFPPHSGPSEDISEGKTVVSPHVTQFVLG